MDNETEKMLLEITTNLKNVVEHNKIMAKQISIAIQGLEVINSMGDSMVESVANQTITAMGECEKKKSSQEEE